MIINFLIIIQGKMRKRDLATGNPELAKEWDYESNGDLTPQDVTENSNKEVRWKCPKGHKWIATVSSRNRGSGCPYCSGRRAIERRAIEGETDLQTRNPELAKEWDYESNGDLTPQDVTENSNKEVRWKCPKGHKWIATVSSRNRGSGCPYCSGRRVIEGETDLATGNPELAKEWDYEANGDLTPQDVTENSKKKVWWKCSKSHRWSATVKLRKNGSGCPYCSGSRAFIKENDFALKYPELVKEWDYEANGDLTPREIVVGSVKKSWWKCSKGHKWEETIANRINGNGCPYCSNKINDRRD